MPRMNAEIAKLHQNIYTEILDTLDKKIVADIMRDPYCPEAQLLNDKVEKALAARILPEYEKKI